MKRYTESLAPFMMESGADTSKNLKNIILLSPSDIGVMRNGGRNGAKFGPKVLINLLKKLNNHICTDTNMIHVKTVTDQNTEQENFENAQKIEGKNIELAMFQSPEAKIIHIGGGHDHAYPFLLGAQEQNYSNILIINIDPHCDTRHDDFHHSGTPFRDFDNNSKIPFHIVQFSTQIFANSSSTMSELTSGSQDCIFIDQAQALFDNIEKLHFRLLAACPFEISADTLIYFSLDCDAIDGSQMKAVSAVNGNGLSVKSIHSLLDLVTHKYPKQVALGIYEYNPVYDDLSCLGSKSICELIYRFLK